MSACRYCDAGFERVRSSVSTSWVHTDTPVGRVVCTRQVLETAELEHILEELNWRGNTLTLAEHDLARAIERVIADRRLHPAV